MRVLARSTGFLAALFLAAAAAFPGTASAGTQVNFQLLGANPLGNRGMNAAPAMYDHTLYIGSRTDGTHPGAGVKIVDVGDPEAPTVMGEIGLPDEAQPSVTSRELRVWPEQKLLMVLNFQCSELIHVCAGAASARSHVEANIKFYDLTDQLHPVLVSTYTPPRYPLRVQGNPTPVTVPLTPHEFFLWIDPTNSERALLFYSTPTTSLTAPNLVVTDISKARTGEFTDLATWNGTDQFSQQVRDDNDVRLHSIAVSNDGTRTYLAYLGGGFLILDSTDVALAVATPKLKLVTPAANRVPALTSVGTHSAVKVPGKPFVLTTDEVYGESLSTAGLFGDHGCPWGWMAMIDIADEVHPRRVSEFKLDQNKASYCESDAGKDQANTYFTSYAAHNPTLVGDLAFITWHSDGLRAISLANPAHPQQVGVFMPDPLPYVTTEDPALSLGTNKVVAWSYPIISDGIIYITDVRNGLYVLRYTGPQAARVAGVKFLEGNSNLGDTLAHTNVLGTRRTQQRPVNPAPNLPTTGLGDLVLPGLSLLAAGAGVGRRLRRGTR